MCRHMPEHENLVECDVIHCRELEIDVILLVTMICEYAVIATYWYSLMNVLQVIPKAAFLLYVTTNVSLYMRAGESSGLLSGKEFLKNQL